MLTTNNYDLPEAIVNAIGQPRKPVPNRFSATDFSGPAHLRRLKEKYWDELTQDVSDMIWLLLGSATHYVLQKGEPDQGLAEEKLEVQYKGNTIVGVTDLWHNETIIDYKTTSVYSFLLGAKPEWQIQLNIYRWLYWQCLGLDTNRLQIHAILRDWQKSKTLSDPEYPRFAFLVQDVPIVDIFPVLDRWLEDYKNDTPCTAEQRWERPTRYAVMKNTNKTATRVFDTKEDASQFVANQTNGNFRIEVRPGMSARCKDYCVVSNVCQNNPYRTEEAA